MKEVTLPSGATLKITLAPFTQSRDLYQAFLEELKGLKIDPTEEVDASFIKDLGCVALTSKKVETALWTCMQRATYNDLKITLDTFEPEASRDDYFTVCLEVAKVNIQPFTKSLYAQYGHVLGMLRGVLS